MPRYSKASDIENEVWQMKWADVPRGTNRALIDQLFNGNPPFPENDTSFKGPNKVNTSFLEATKIGHDARRQFSNAFLKPGNYFSVKVDRGPRHKRSEHASIITTQINRLMKRSLPYRESLRNVFAQVVVHGVGPASWDTREKWVPRMQSMGDVMIPDRTELTMDGMDKFAIYRRYTAEQLGRMITGNHVDKALNVPLVKKAMSWARKQTGLTQPFDNTLYSPERIVEDFKENSGVYSSSQVPTVNCWDWYFLDDEDNKNFGWKRRIVLDSEAPSLSADIKNIIGGRNQFLYDSGDRNYARNLGEIIHFQFGDGSTVAPFRYHNVRGLGLLLYSVCNLQNRLRCRFTEAVFESLMQFYQCATSDEQEWLIKAALVDKGVLPDGVKFVGANERWKVPLQEVQIAMQMNRQTMEDSSSSFTQDFDFAKSNVEKTATEVMADVSATQALVSSMLQEAYGYQEFQYREICRRFCIQDSKDPDVRAFRVECLKRGVPEECLDANAWDISADRIIGSGNKQMELAQINLLMQNYQRYGPKQQKIILHKATLAWTDDPAMADELAPIEDDGITEGRRDAQMATASLMDGFPFDERSGIDEIGFIEGLLTNLTIIVQRIEQNGGMATMEQIIGMDNMSAHIKRHIAILGQDPEEKRRVKDYGDDLGKLENLIKAYKQRLEEQMQKQAEAQQQDPEAMAKVQAIAIAAKTKDAIAKEKHAQSTIQKEEKFRQAQQHKDEQHRQAQAAKEATVQTDLTAKVAQTEQSLADQQVKTEHEIEMGKMKAEHESEKGSGEGKPARESKSKGSKSKRIKFEFGKNGKPIGAVVTEE